MITVKVTGIERPAGRKHEYIRIFGIREGDENEKLVEVAVSPRIAADLFATYLDTNEFAELEVDDRAWAYCLRIGTPDVVFARRQQS